jgi:hypothetical protein
MFQAYPVFHIHISPSTSSGQRNCTSWASQPQTSVTLPPQRGGETTKSTRDMWWHWQKKIWVTTKILVFQDMAPCQSDECFGDVCCFRSTVNFQLWKRRHQDTPKRRQLYTNLPVYLRRLLSSSTENFNLYLKIHKSKEIRVEAEKHLFSKFVRKCLKARTTNCV